MLTLTYFQELLVPYINDTRDYINSQCEGLEPWQVISYSIGATLVGVWTWGVLFHPEECKLLMLTYF